MSLDGDNATIAVTMNEGSFNANNGSGALQTSDFALSISGGAATLASATPTSIAINGNVYTLGVGLSGIANGNETLTVVPAANNAIYDTYGNAISTSQSNNTAGLNATGESLNFDGTNDYIQIASNGDLIIKNGKISITAWIKSPANHSSNWGAVVGGWNGYGYNLYAATTIMAVSYN